MKKELTRTDVGELEFQLRFYTGLRTIVTTQTSNICEIMLIKDYDDETCMNMCEIVLWYDKNGIQIVKYYIRNGNLEEHDLIEKNFKKAIECFNYLWVK